MSLPCPLPAKPPDSWFRLPYSIALPPFPVKRGCPGTELRTHSVLVDKPMVNILKLNTFRDQFRNRSELVECLNLRASPKSPSPRMRGGSCSNGSPITG